MSLSFSPIQYQSISSHTNLHTLYLSNYHYHTITIDESVEEFVLKRGIADVLMLNGVYPSPGTYNVSTDTIERCQASNYRSTANSSTFFHQSSDAVGSSADSSNPLPGKEGMSQGQAGGGKGGSENNLHLKNANGGELSRGNVYVDLQR